MLVNLFILRAKLTALKIIAPTLILLCLFCMNAEGQLLKTVIPGTNTGFTENLEKIVQDYRNNYRRIQGKKIPGQTDMDVYQSTVNLPGCSQALILRFRSKQDTTAGWQGTMYSGEQYKEALKIYKSTCKQIKGCRVNIQGKGAGVFKGTMETPDENVRFAGSSFKLDTEDKAYRDYYAEVELVNTGMESWEVHLNLQYKKDDASEY